jgi:hypothetical protein
MFAACMLFQVFYLFCVGLWAAFPELRSHGLLIDIFSGFNLLDVSSFFYGLIASAMYGWLVAVVFVFFYNLWAGAAPALWRRSRQAATAEQKRLRHTEARVRINASADRLFDHLDDAERLGAHMKERSAMMMGGRMTYELDEAKGRKLGSVIRMGGRFLGIPLSVEETVVERNPPHRKTWETRGAPRLLVIGSYRMGFEIAPDGADAGLRVFIDYELPTSALGRALGGVIAPSYASWCVGRMAEDATRSFNSSGTASR